MSLRIRPIHCKFETLRLAGEIGRNTDPYHRIGRAASLEQLSARHTGHMGRCSRSSSGLFDLRP